MFDGEWYCKPCGEAIAATLPDPNAWEREHPDSLSYPVAYDSSEGESDTPDHCGTPDCQLFLERNLTEDGIEYVRDAIIVWAMKRMDRDLAPGHGRGDTVQEWVDYYGIAQAKEGE